MSDKSQADASVDIDDTLMDWIAEFTGIDPRKAATAQPPTSSAGPSSQASASGGYETAAGPMLTSIKGDARNPAAVAQWIEANVPCFSGPVPKDWVDKVKKEAANLGIDRDILELAFTLTHKDGYVWPAGPPQIQPHIAPPLPGDDGPRMGPIDPETARRGIIAEAKRLEEKYEIASNSHDHKAMEKLAKQFADLLNGAEPNPAEEEEMQHGAPLLRRVIVWPRSAPQGGRGGVGGGPYRVSPEIDVDEEEEEEAE